MTAARPFAVNRVQERVCIHTKTYTLSTSIFIFIPLFIENHQFTLMTSIPVQPWGFVLVFPFLYLKFPSPSRRNLALVRLSVFIYLVNPRISCCHTPWPLTIAQCPSPSPHFRFMCLLCLAREVYLMAFRLNYSERKMEIVHFYGCIILHFVED